MAKTGNFGANADRKRKHKDTLPKSRPTSGRDILRRDEHFRIAPKHPGMGRR